MSIAPGFYYLLIAVSLIALTGSYFIYPLIFFLIAMFSGKTSSDSSASLPTVSLIVSLCNEEKQIVSKTLKNRLAIDYPEDKLVLVFIIDGYSGGLNNLFNGTAKNVKVYETGERGGKTRALNKFIPMLDSEILVFSDANSLYRPDSVKKLVRNFKKPEVGGVCGELRYVDDELPDMTGKLSNVYMKYEQFVKIAESKVSTLTVYNGAIYAIRKPIHQEMNPQAANDFQHPVQVALKGYKSVYEPEAVAFENTVKNDSVEFKRTVRITARGWKGFFAYPQIINPFKTGLFSIQFAFRKLLRWLSPLFLILLFGGTFMLREQAIFYLFFLIQILFYILAFGGWLLRKNKLNKLIYYPYYFCLVNLAALLGFITFLTGKDTATWAPSITDW